MEILHTDNGKKGAFYIEMEATIVAEITYTYAGNDKIIIDHTQVSDSLKGKGIGYKLLDAVVNFMRSKAIKAIPLCPFAAAVFKKKQAEYADVLA